MPASVTYTFSAGTTISSSAMNQNFTDLVSYLNGANVADANISSTGLSADSLTSTVNQQLGLSETGTVRRGKSIIATEESRTNTALRIHARR